MWYAPGSCVFTLSRTSIQPVQILHTSHHRAVESHGGAPVPNPSSTHKDAMKTMSIARTRTRLAACLVAAGVVAGVAGTSASHASWNDSTKPFENQIITSGDLDLQAVGPMVAKQWNNQTKQNVIIEDPKNYRGSEVDNSVFFEQKFKPVLDGDNIAGKIRLVVPNYEDPQMVDAIKNFAISFGLTKPNGDTIYKDLDPNENEDGTSEIVWDVEPEDLNDEFTLTIDATPKTSADWSSDIDLTEIPQPSDLGHYIVHLDQVRTGEGFTS